jgi:hypothetical protein
MLRAYFEKLWSSLPYDGHGLLPPVDATFASLRRWAAPGFWKRVPWWSRPALVPLARIAWVVFCLRQTYHFIRTQALPPPLMRGLLVDCLCTGARPVEAFIWRQFFPSSGRHPLPGRAAGVLLSRLGSVCQHRLLADKQAAAELLNNAGLPVPRTLEIIPRGCTTDLGSPVWSRLDAVFVKPRHGAASRGAMTAADFLRGVRSAPPEDDLLVQTRLCAAPELADLVTDGAPPVLRLTTARLPGDAAFLHSALLSIDVPGERPRDFMRGQIRVVIDPVTGCMESGIWFLRPGERYPRLPWNGAPLAGRRRPCLEQALEMALRAIDLVPDLPLVNWDLIPTPCVPSSWRAIRAATGF